MNELFLYRRNILINTQKTLILEDVVCPHGCKKNDEMVLAGRDLLHASPGKFTLVKCHNCGLMRTNPRPTPESMGGYYPDDYGPYLGTRVHQTKPKLFSTIKNLLRPLVNRVFNFNTQHLPSMVPGRLLEVGCASGAFLHQMAKQGWQVQGIEFSEKAAEAAAQLGYPVYAGSLEAAPISAEPFDLIVGWMVLEHLHAPIAGLKKLRECAKPGAWLVLSIPNAGSLEFRLFKDKWYALHLPNHLYHFTPETISRLLDACGWEVVKIHHHRVLTNLLVSVGYVLQDKGCLWLGRKLTKLPKYTNYVLYPIAWLLSLCGETGRMTIWVKKKGND